VYDGLKLAKTTTMIIDQHLNRVVAERLIRQNKQREKTHTPSGKLSASSLGNPLQWQILKTLGVPSKELDEYTLRKFVRGNHVEDWVVSQMPGVVDKQKYVEYRGAVGYVDSLINTSEGYDFKNGIICNEVKSVTNAAFKWLMKDRTPKYGHSLQGAFYALAEGHSHFAITYVASDDYRLWMVVQETKKYQKDIDAIIDNYNQALKDKVVPVFEPVEKWQGLPKYNNYPEWAELNEKEIKEKLKKTKARWPK
jgi:hypothetical protein